MERQNEYEETIGEPQDYDHSSYEESTDIDVEEPEIVEEESGDEEPTVYSHADEDEEAEEEPVNKGRLPGNARIQQIQREKYQAIHESNRLQQENEYLRRMALDLNNKATESGNAAMIHYDNSANLKLEHAKSRKIQAHEEGNVQAEIDADVDIASATAEIQHINHWKAQQAMENRNRQQQYEQQQYDQQYAQQTPQQPDQQVSVDWLERNAWFNPHSHDFSPELAHAAREYSEKVENFLYRNGRPDLIMSEQYYDEIDSYIQQLHSQRGQGMGKKQLNMRPVRGGSTPVRNTSSNASRSSEKHQLSREEREIARVMGIKDKDYLASKLSDKRDMPHRWRNGGYNA